MYSYSLAYLKYLNKYVLTTNVSAYVKYDNTFACQNYLRKIIVLRISVYAGGHEYAEQNYLMYIVLTCKCIDILHMRKDLQVNTYLFKYF